MNEMHTNSLIPLIAVSHTTDDLIFEWFPIGTLQTYPVFHIKLPFPNLLLEILLETV